MHCECHRDGRTHPEVASLDFQEPSASSQAEIAALEEDTRHLAYTIYELCGRENGHDLEDWVLAEKLRGRGIFHMIARKEMRWTLWMAPCMLPSQGRAALLSSSSECVLRRRSYVPFTDEYRENAGAVHYVGGVCSYHARPLERTGGHTTPEKPTCGSPAAIQNQG